MANTVAFRGLYNPRLITGGTPHTRTFKLATDYGTDFYPGQPFTRLSTGYIRHILVTNSTSTAGVCMSFLPNPSGQTADTEGNKELFIQGIDDLWNTEWEVQLSHAAEDPAVGVLGNNMAYYLAAGVDATRRLSKLGALETADGTVANVLRVVEFVEDSKNEKTAANPRVVVRFNESHFERGITTGV